MILPPIEKYQVEDKEVFVVRDDLPFPFPSPNFSKIRGLSAKLINLHEQGVKTIASQDTIISRCGWGVSYLSKKFDMTHYNFHSRRKSGQPDFYRKMSAEFGGILVPMWGTKSRIFRVFAKRWLDKKNIKAYFLPVGLSLPETITEHHSLIPQLSPDLFQGSLVCCISSGTILSGIISGLLGCDYKTKVYGIVTSGFKKRRVKVIDNIQKTFGRKLDLSSIHTHNCPLSEFMESSTKGLQFETLNLGYQYYQKEPLAPPFPCDQYLDRKAWKFLVDNIDKLEEPITFWNIGGEWNPDFGMGNGLRGDGSIEKVEVEKYVA